MGHPFVVRVRGSFSQCLRAKSARRHWRLSEIILMKMMEAAKPNNDAHDLPTAVDDGPAGSADALYEQGLNALAAGDAVEAARLFRAAIDADETYIDAHHGLVRALRDAGRLEQAVGAALALTALTPGDPLAHTALSISLQHAGHVPEAEAAAARARIQEWKQQLAAPLSPPSSSEDSLK